jgi:hypothetical protein
MGRQGCARGRLPLNFPVFPRGWALIAFPLSWFAVGTSGRSCWRVVGKTVVNIRGRNEESGGVVGRTRTENMRKELSRDINEAAVLRERTLPQEGGE